MALSNNTIWEVRPSTGADTSGGGFVPGIGTKTVTGAVDLTIDAANNLKVTGAHSFVSGDVGKFLNITAGTGWTAGWYQVTSLSSGAGILDHSPSAAGNANKGTYDLYDGTDYSQQPGPQYNFADLASTTGTSATPAVTSTSHSFVAADVGNLINISAGTNWTAGIYAINSVSGGAATLDRACGSAATLSSGTYAVGGALATLSKVAGAYVRSNKIFVKAEATISLTAGVTFATGATPSSTIPKSKLIGYTTARGDLGRVTIQLSTNSALTALTLSGSGIHLQNFIIDCNSLTTSTGLSITGNYGAASNCLVKNFTTAGITASALLVTLYGDEITAGIAGATAAISVSNEAYIVRNYVHDNACTAIAMTGSQPLAVAVLNLVTNNTGATSDGITYNLGTVIMFNTVYGSGRDNIRSNTGTGFYANVMLNNLLAKAGAWGINSTAALAAELMWDGNAFWSNTLGNRSGFDDTTNTIIDGCYPYANLNDVAVSTDPFTNDAGGDFTLNATASAGASIRGAGLPKTYPGASGTAYSDFGAFQHQDPAGGGGLLTHPGTSGGMRG